MDQLSIQVSGVKLESTDWNRRAWSEQHFSISPKSGVEVGSMISTGVWYDSEELVREVVVPITCWMGRGGFTCVVSLSATSTINVSARHTRRTVHIASAVRRGQPATRHS